jgi:hypothetical protein
VLPAGGSAGVHLTDGAGARALRLGDGSAGGAPAAGWGPLLPLDDGDYTSFLPLARAADAPAGARLICARVGAGAGAGGGVERLERVIVVQATSDGASQTLLVREPSAGETDLPYWLHNLSSHPVRAAQAPCAALPAPGRFTPAAVGACVPLLFECHACAPDQLGWLVCAGVGGASGAGVRLACAAADDAAKDGAVSLELAGATPDAPRIKVVARLEARGPIRALVVRDAPPPFAPRSLGLVTAARAGAAPAPPPAAEPLAAAAPLLELALSLSLAHVGVSVISAGRELLYAAVEGVSASVRGGARREARLSVGWFEVSNQLPSAPFAALLRPSAAKVGAGARAAVASAAVRGGGGGSGSGHGSAAALAAARSSAAFELLVVQTAPPTATASVFGSVVARLAPSELALDTHSLALLLAAGADVARALDEMGEMMAAAAGGGGGGGGGGGAADARVRSAEDVLAAELADAARGGARAVHRSFVRWLFLQPCVLRLSARSSGSGFQALLDAMEQLQGDASAGAPPSARAGLGRASARVVRNVFRNSLSSALLNFTRAGPLRVQELRVDEFWGPSAQLQAAVGAHYSRCAGRQLQSLVGSVEVLGNPNNLFGHLATGVYDAFYEPYDGLVTGPAEFVLGVGKGGISFAQNVLTGVSGTAASLTGSLARGVAELSADKAYVDRRADRASQRGAVRDAGEGAVRGLRSVSEGIFRGVQGVVMDPIRGARRHGAEGLAKGVVTGVLGLVVKPVVGAVELASGVAEGVAASSATAEDQRALAALQQRARLPRAFGPHGEVVPFAEQSARFAAVLESIRRESNSRRFEADRLIGHTVNVLVTTDHLIGIDLHQHKRAPTKLWHLTLEQVASCEPRERSVALHLVGGAQRELVCAGPEAKHLHELITHACRTMRNLVLDE